MIKRILIAMILITCLLQITIPLQDAYSARPIIIFDKPTYNPFATAKILVVDPVSDRDKDNVEVVKAVVHTKSNVGNIFEFTEVAPDAGVFQALVRLTPNNSEWPADIVVQRSDELFVEFNSAGSSSVSSVKIDFSTSLIMFDKVQYGISEEVKIFVLDIGANKVPNARDTLEIIAWSTSDIKGLKVMLKEIDIDIGVFAGTLSLSKDQPSSDTVLKSSNADVITAKYTQKTEPPSSKPNAIPEIKDLFAAALVGQKKTETDFEPTSGPEVVDQFGDPVTDVKLGEVIIVQDNVVNNQNANQKFAYIVLIKDKEGITVSLSWLTGELLPSSTFKAGQSWVPEETGEYEIEIFLWKSIDNPVALAPPKSVTILVTHPLL